MTGDIVTWCDASVRALCDGCDSRGLRAPLLERRAGVRIAGLLGSTLLFWVAVQMKVRDFT